MIGGWTEPRQTRTYFGALLLGVYEGSTESRIPVPNPWSTSVTPAPVSTSASWRGS